MKENNVGIGMSNIQKTRIVNETKFVKKKCDKWKEGNYCFSTSVSRPRVYCGSSPCFRMPPWGDEIN